MVSEVPPDHRVLRWFDWRILPVLGLTVGIVGALFGSRGTFAELVDGFPRVRWEWLVAATGTLGIQLCVAGLRWRTILAAMGHPLRFWSAMKAMFVAMPFALLTPSRAGELVRALAIGETVPLLVGAGSVVAERFIDVQVLAILAFVASLARGLPLWAGVAVLVMIVSWSAIFVVAHAERWIIRIPLMRRIVPKFGQMQVAFRHAAQSPRTLILACFASLASWVLNLSFVQMLLWATQADVSPLLTLSFWPLAVFGGLVPVTLAGMGTRDAVFLALLQTQGAVDDVAVLLATLSYAFLGSGLTALIGLPFAVRLFPRRRRAD